LSLRIETVITGLFKENSYIGWHVGSSNAFLIDPGDDYKLIIKVIEDNHLIPNVIINTHAHLDHISAVQPLKEKYNIPFYLHSEEKTILDTYEDSCQIFGLPIRQKPEVDIWFNDEQKIKIKQFTFNTLNTPGHTPGGTCLQLENHLFVGDTLFKGSIGRTDLPGGNLTKLESSLVHLLKSMNHNFIVHSGHGPDTSLGVELKENPFLIPLQNRLT